MPAKYKMKVRVHHQPGLKPSMTISRAFAPRDKNKAIHCVHGLNPAMYAKTVLHVGKMVAIEIWNADRNKATRVPVKDRMHQAFSDGIAIADFEALVYPFEFFSLTYEKQRTAHLRRAMRRYGYTEVHGAVHRFIRMSTTTLKALEADANVDIGLALAAAARRAVKPKKRK